MARKRRKTASVDKRQLMLFSDEEMERGSLVSAPEPIVAVSQAPAPLPFSPESEMVETENHAPFEETAPAETFPDNRHSAEHDLLLNAMRSAINRLSTMHTNQIRLIAMESATRAQNGINTEQKYTIQALNQLNLNGYDFIAIYYVSFARAFPGMLDKINLPYADVYEEALGLGK